MMFALAQGPVRYLVVTGGCLAVVAVLWVVALVAVIALHERRERRAEEWRERYVPESWIREFDQ
jgi:hypothetical protein